MRVLVTARNLTCQVRRPDPDSSCRRTREEGTKMGWWAAGLIQGQKPRKNGCICALIPVIGGPVLGLITLGYTAVQVIA